MGISEPLLIALISWALGILTERYRHNLNSDLQVKVYKRQKLEELAIFLSEYRASLRNHYAKRDVDSQFMRKLQAIIELYFPEINRDFDQLKNIHRRHLGYMRARDERGYAKELFEKEIYGPTAELTYTMLTKCKTSAR